MKAGGASPAWPLLGLALFGSASCADEGWTTKHEKGRCAMKGSESTGGFFSSTLPVANNSLAEQPDNDLREKLVDVCGEDWLEGRVCCTEEQVDTLKSNLGKANSILGSCGACKTNFYNLFCTFTCSPDQSLFVNITETQAKEDLYLVKELDNLWSDDFGTGFWNSCKDVKVSGTNSRAVELMADGAKNYTQLLNGLGRKKFGGSPFQINFPRPSEGFPGMQASDRETFPCNSTDPNLRCACVECESSCVEAPAIAESEQCYVGLLPCLSFAAILVYSTFIALLVTAVTGHVAYRKHAQSKSERLRLLQDTSLSDDEDGDDDAIYQAGIINRPSRTYALNTICDTVFSRLGRTCARYPAIVITTSVVVVALLSLGWLNFSVETDPVRLWVAPDSAAAQEKQFFDDNFGPFFRAEQAFLVNDTDAGTVLSTETLKWWAGVESRVQKINTTNGITLEDVCFAPTGDACIVQSVLRYWDSDDGFDPDDWESRLTSCVENPAGDDCRPKFQQPISPKLVLGGYDDSAIEAQAMVTTWVVRNAQPGDEQVERAMDWEASMKALLLTVQDEAKERGLRLSFNTEISLEQELNKSTNTDAKIVVISYIIMFIYASLALGSTTVSVRHTLRNPASALVDSKFMLGVAGIVIVLLSVSASVGLFSAAGVKVTLIIAEVIPFLVLAVGVDNIFLIVHEFERVNASHPDTTVEERVSKALGRMGPSILLSATMETVAFALGAFVGMPAVRNFAAYAAGAVFINALLQVTMFISVLALNQIRVEANRVDCFPCIRVRQSASTFQGDYAVAEEDSLQRFIRRVYAPALLGKKTKVAVVTVFLGLFAAAIALLPSIKLGLDQRIALPSDSYLIDYFDDLALYFDTGPPVYFVARHVDASKRKGQKELCGSFPTCDEYSLVNLVEAERKRPGVSYIIDTPASWVDDFFKWLDPQYTGCCVDPETGRPCFANRNPPFNKTLSGMPESTEYVDYLRIWLSDVPSETCPYGGKAQFSDAVVYESTSTALALLSDLESCSGSSDRILASHFRTSHTPLRTQDDFIAAYASARRICASISDRNSNIDIFPYSKFYIYFDQYATIVPVTLRLLAAGVLVCFLISALLLGSIRTAAVVSITVIMTLTSIGGAMAIANVSLNAVTLVNLVISVGIAVEFCAHIARAFQFPSPRLLDRGVPTAGKIALAADGLPAAASTLRGRDARAYAALVQVGGSVFSGITVTKFLGVCVLAFTRSKIFEIYYFRVWLALVVFAALHALVFLPVALSWGGGAEGYVSEGGEGGLEEDLARRRGGGPRGRGRPYMEDFEDEEEEEDARFFDERQ